MALDEVVGTPFDRVKQVVGLGRLGVTLREDDATHGKDRDGVGHGEAELDEVTGCNDQWQAISDQEILIRLMK